MLKHKHIIDKMSVKQKITLLTNIKCLSEPEFTAIGIPHTSIARIEDVLLGIGEGINQNILARSWNPDAVRSVAEELINTEETRNANLMIAPSAKIKINPYKPAISEDPYITGEFAGAYLSAIKLAEIPASIDGLKLESEDVDYLDLVPNRRILQEYFIKPFKNAVEHGECSAVITSPEGPGNGYGNANLKTMQAVRSGILQDNVNVLCDHLSSDTIADVWGMGGIAMSGVASDIEHAYEKYKQIVIAIHEGHATVNDLEDAYSDGSAISDEMMDAAVSRVIDFAYSCNPDFISADEAEQEEITEAIAQDNVTGEDAEASNTENAEITNDTVDGEVADAEETVENDPAPIEVPKTVLPISKNLLGLIRESIVLLKNENNILPINRSARVAVIGDYVSNVDGEYFIEKIAEEIGPSYLGYAKGYDLNADKTEEHISAAVELASKADVVLVFLGIDEKRLSKISLTKRLQLPANQAALLASLSQFKEKIIGVVGGDLLPGTANDEYLSALLLAPVGGRHAARALIDIVAGRYSPSGRLSETRYDNPDEYFETVKFNKDCKFNKIGPFMGYRHYDTSSENVNYPFGYGLTYTSFEYSNLTVSGNTVSFTLRNTGNYIGVETVQLYVGKKDSQYIRPLKELKAFKRISLTPGQAMPVKLDISDLSVYSEQTKKFIVESGRYQIYVGSSVSDIRLTAEINVLGTSNTYYSKKAEKRSDYIFTDSNILSDNYTLEARGKYMKRTKKWTISYIIGLALTIIVNAILISIQINLGDSFLVLGKSILAMIVLFNIFAVSFVVFAIVGDIISAKRFNSLHEPEDLDLIKKEFSGATLLEGWNIEDLFVKEFDEAIAKDDEAKPRRGFDLSDYSRFVDDGMNFVVAQKSLVKYGEKHGIIITPETAGNVLASLATSRLILMKSSNNEDANKFASVLADYFDTKQRVESVDATYVDGNLLFKKNEDGSISRTPVIEMFSSAAEHKEKIHFVTLTDATAELVTNLFSRYIRFLNNPERECSITINDEKFTVPENVWFLVSMKDGEKVEGLPVYMAELMARFNADFTEMATENMPESDVADSDVNAEVTGLMPLGYYQLAFMAQKSKNNFVLSEDLWKKVDSFEEYASKRSSYRFGNKMWLRLEKYLSVLNSCEFEPNPAVDYTLNAIVIHVVQIVLDGKLGEEDNGILEVLEIFFGEDNVPVCRKTLKGVSLTQD